MAAGFNFKFTTTSGNVIDLTSTAVNPDAAPAATPRQSGFTIRNRWNCNNLATANKRTFEAMDASTTASFTKANILKVLKVPRRTVVKAPVRVFAVEGETIPGHSVLGAATKADLNSAGAAGILGFTAYAYNDASQTAASLKRHVATGAYGNTVVAGCPLGGVPIQKFDSLNGAFEASLVEAVDTSMTAPWLGKVNAAPNAASQKFVPCELYFPYGGFVTMSLGPNNVALGAMASSKGAASATGMYGLLSGTWEVEANCEYIPE